MKDTGFEVERGVLSLIWGELNIIQGFLLKKKKQGGGILLTSEFGVLSSFCFIFRMKKSTETTN